MNDAINELANQLAKRAAEYLSQKDDEFATKHCLWVARTERGMKRLFKLSSVVLVGTPEGIRATGFVFGRSPDPVGEFADGHRILTSPIVNLQDGRIETENSVYEVV